jgi:hypothetical protein
VFKQDHSVRADPVFSRGEPYSDDLLKLTMGSAEPGAQEFSLRGEIRSVFHILNAVRCPDRDVGHGPLKSLT